MNSTTIRLPIRNLPDHFDRSRISDVVEEIELALMEGCGVQASGTADSFTITLEVPTSSLADAANLLAGLKLI